MSIFSKLGEKIVDGYVKIKGNKQRKKRMIVEFENAIHMKKLENIAAGNINEAKWNEKSIEKAGWRPGFLTIVLSAPMILVFFPPMVVYIEQGFIALDQTPQWYRILIGVMVSSAFGVKKLSDYFMNKKYG